MTESVAYPGGSARRQSIGEEVLNAISHGIGAVMAVIGTVLLVLRAKEEGDLLNIISVAIFGGSMILLYLISCLYHALPRSKGKQVFQILDHCSIFLLILGTYTPICLITVGGTFGLTIFGINLACGIVGIVLNAVSLKRWKKVSLVLYIVMGWLGILALPTIWRKGCACFCWAVWPIPWGLFSIGRRRNLIATVFGISLFWLGQFCSFLRCIPTAALGKRKTRGRSRLP